MSVTELEGVILGIVSSRQPCSAYVIRRRFEESPTWGWSKSKGAIYPAVSRLISRGSLAAEQASVGRRQKELLTLTELGRGDLIQWINAIPTEMGGAPVDPIRTRVNYLGNLNPAERNQFLERAERAARDALMRSTLVVPDPEAAEAWTLHATALGVQMQIKAKIEWLRAVRKLTSSDWSFGGKDS